jgi:hypothetical protein
VLSAALPIYSATLLLHPVLHLEVQSPGSFDISSLSSVQQASSVRSLTVPVVSSSCLFFLPASGLEKKVKISPSGGSCYPYSSMAVLLAAIESSLASAFHPAESGAKGSDASWS